MEFLEYIMWFILGVFSAMLIIPIMLIAGWFIVAFILKLFEGKN